MTTDNRTPNPCDPGSGGQESLPTPAAEAGSPRGDATCNRVDQMELVRVGLFVVLEIATGFKDSGVPLLDLMVQGCPGLILAMDTYESAKDGDFRSYASPMIDQSIRHALANQARAIRLIAEQAEDFRIE